MLQGKIFNFRILVLKAGTSLAASLTLLLVACGVSENGTEQRGITDTHSNQTLLLTAVDPDYLSSSLWAFDLTTGEVARGPGGLSGDPLLTFINDQPWLFNRSTTNLNGRIIIGENLEKSLDREIKFEGAGVGDPGAIVGLGDQSAALSHYNNSRIVVADTVSGSIVRDLGANLDLGQSNRVMRISILFHDRSRDLIIGIHQARDFEYKYDGSQQFFAWRASSFEAVDLDSSAVGIQGKALTIGNPQTTYYDSALGQLTVAGFCSVFDDPSCKSGAEVIDVDSFNVTTAWIWERTDRLGNGSVAFSKDGTTLWAQMAAGSGAGSRKFLVAIDAATGSGSDLFEYAADGSGCCFLKIDPLSGRLYTADRTGDSAAELMWFDPDSTVPQRITTSGLAYGGLFVP